MPMVFIRRYVYNNFDASVGLLLEQIWEETLKAMIKYHPSFQETVDEIWLFDAVNQGDSAIVNEGNLGDICESEGSL